MEKAHDRWLSQVFPNSFYFLYSILLLFENLFPTNSLTHIQGNILLDDGSKETITVKQMLFVNELEREET
jgi:hypothetical protein